MGSAICTAIIVLLSGYLGSFLGEVGCIWASIAAAAACIVYAIRTQKRYEHGEKDREDGP